MSALSPGVIALAVVTTVAYSTMHLLSGLALITTPGSRLSATIRAFLSAPPTPT